VDQAYRLGLLRWLLFVTEAPVGSLAMFTTATLRLVNDLRELAPGHVRHTTGSSASSSSLQFAGRKVLVLDPRNEHQVRGLHLVGLYLDQHNGPLGSTEQLVARLRAPNLFP
jgi:hypothetical protein